MTTPETKPDNKVREASWAKPVDRLSLGDIDGRGMNINVDGKQLTGPLRGFGQMWQKTYKIRLEGIQISPQTVIQGWKEHFSKFWPKGNYFYSSPGAIAPGKVAALNLAGPGGMTAPGGTPLISTGVMVIYADDESFSFMTPDGHIFAGMITFSSYESNDGTCAQIQALIRANDPVYELGARLGVVHKTEDIFWHNTLRNLAQHFGSAAEGVEQANILVDPRVQWNRAGNIWHNAAIRTGIFLAGAPFRWVKRLFTR